MSSDRMVPDRIGWQHVLGFVGVLVLLGVVAAAIPALSMSLDPDTGNVGIVQLNGPIMDESQVGAQGVSPDAIASMTEQAQDDRMDAIIYEINSPGGSVVASKDAARAVEQADVPTICLMKDTAASGAYWLATRCDHIVADSATITGSIGASAAYLEFSGLMEEFGVEYMNLTSGELKDMGSPYRELTEEEHDRFAHILDSIHDEFVQSVADNRDMSIEEVEEAATGEIFLGADAKEMGLVDTLGSHDEAIDVAKEKTNTTELQESEYSPPQRLDLFSLFFTQIGEGIIEGMRGQEEYGINARYP